MKEKYFHSAEFWTRELKIPLFWLPSIAGNKSLTFYKNSVIHLYYLNGREIKSASLGYKFFSSGKNVNKYKKGVENTLLKINKIKSKYEKIKLDEFSNSDLKRELFGMLDFLNEYGEVYMKTEAVYLEKFADEPVKYRSVLKKLGNSRFALRREGEPIFYILLGFLLKELARRFNLKVSDLFFYKLSELQRTFGGEKVHEKIIRERKRGYALIFMKNKQILLTGKKFKELYKEVVFLKCKITELVGRVAMLGKVMGKIRLILHNKRDISKEIAKFKQGEILVTEMTRPDTILACKKAAAIITDEGGITSHAAIIARELKIPCIIATKIATQVLKDGDLVEVDANRGVVRIIK